MRAKQHEVGGGDTVGFPDLAQYLQRELDQRGISQRELSVRSGIGIATLNDMIQDRGHVPSLPTLAKLASGLGAATGDTAQVLYRLIELVGYGLERPDMRSPAWAPQLTDDDWEIMNELSHEEVARWVDLLRAWRRRAGRGDGDA